MNEVVSKPRPAQDLADVLAPDRFRHLVEDEAPRVAAAMSDRAVVHVNSTAAGGGVAEMLQTLVPLANGFGVRARWLVIDGDPEFFALTKSIHNLIHGSPLDSGTLGDREHGLYEGVAEMNEAELRALTSDRDLIVLHDPQTVGLAPYCASRGQKVIWRCHIGVDEMDESSHLAWEFLRRYLEGHVDAYVFTREAYAPPWVPRDRLHVIPPSIDPLALKNVPIAPDRAVAILQQVGLVGGSPQGRPTFTRRDGGVGEVRRYSDVIGSGPLPAVEVPLVTQVGRWDRLKDPAGVITGFAEHVVGGTEAHLVLAGPSVASVADDPESADVLAECWSVWRTLSDDARSRIRLACLPMADGEENAVIVNALQRHAHAVVQKSSAEGFGLTVTEAMYKGRPVIASNVGGIADQITHGCTGLLLDDPSDLAGFGELVRSVLDDATLAATLGAGAFEFCRDNFLPDTHLSRWGRLLEAVLD